MAIFRILGPVTAHADEHELALAGHRQLSLLAYLLLNANRAVSTDTLTDALWGPNRPAGDNRLQMAITRLRKALEPLNPPDGPRLRTVSGGYLLTLQPDELDAQLFAEMVRGGRAALDAGDAARAVELLDGALALWRGPPLAEVAFEDFAQGDIRRLEELRLEAVEMRGEAELQLGRHHQLISELEALLADHPTSERLAGQLMLALYRSGRQADALEVYQRTRTHLGDQLGLEPGPALQALQHDILGQAPSLEHHGATPRPDRPGAQRTELPPGTVTFMFTDIEGSTGLLRELGSERYADELGLHRDRVRRAVAAHGGREFGTEGDALFIAFARASDALRAASDAQAALTDGPVRVRIGIHTGEPLLVDTDYVGLDVHKAARICAAAHGGQVVVSQATRDLAGEGLRDLGQHRLKDLTAPERLFQLGDSDFPPLRALRPTNLPVQPTVLVGRQSELTELVPLALTSRVLTLTGPGGTGKTRLALELAAQLSDEFADGVWWVPLAAITDPALVLPTIAHTLGRRDDLRDLLAGKRVLLLLDNLEQVLDAAPLIADLLAELPDLSVIATSRERLAVGFEQEYLVPPLDDAAAEELFVSLARRLKPGFEPDEAVGELCRRLDRLPLALELVSSRVKLMSTTEILSRIERRLDLLSARRRDAPPRQATMRAAIDWSFDLLTEHERTLFRGLAVFAGSFELDAAEAVCGADLDDLQSAIEKSLLRRDGRGRFFLLELTREYALEQLRVTGEEPPLRRRHADWFLKLTKLAHEHLQSAEQGRWLARLDADTANLRAALAWCSEHDPAAAIELATTLFRPWWMHGQLQELSSWLERALVTTTLDARTRAKGLRALGEALNFIDQHDQARPALEQSLALFRELGDGSGEASVLMLLGMLAGNQGSLEEAIELHQAALAIERDAGDRPGLARTLNILGGCLLSAGDLERSRAALEEAAAIHRELGDDQRLAADLGGLGDIALDKLDLQQAADYYRDGLDLVSGFGDERNELYGVAGLASVAALEGDRYAAGRLWGVIEAAEIRLGMRMIAAERTRYEQIMIPLQGDHAFRAGYESGRDVDLAQAVRELRTI